MKIRHLVRAIPVALVGLIAISSGISATAQPAGDLSIQNLTAVDGGDLRILGLSPDGRWLFGSGDDEVCAIDAASGDRAACAAYPFGLNEDAIAFSPDGSRVAFHEQAAQYLIDANLWVFDLLDGALTNLTDDGYEGRTFSLRGAELPLPILVDTNPAWSPDGQTLAFSRSIVHGGDRDDAPYTTELYTMPAGGGEPTLVGQVSEEPFAVYYGLGWLPTGDGLTYLRDTQEDDANDGLWVLEFAADEPRLVHPLDPERVPAILRSVSPTGQALLDFHGSQRPDEHGALLSLVDLATGDVTSLAPSVETGEAPLYQFTLSPDGTRALYVDSPGDRLLLRELATGADVDLTAALPVGERPDLFAFRLSWAANDLVYVSSTPVVGTLITLTSV